jgi:hypothetical protein
VKLSGQEFQGSQLTIQLAKDGSKSEASVSDKKEKKKPEKVESKDKGKPK